jgi:hypothetical protein
VAPPARQGAALQKNGGPDARAIVDGIFFYVKNFTGLHVMEPFDCGYGTADCGIQFEFNLNIIASNVF